MKIEEFTSQEIDAAILRVETVFDGTPQLTLNTVTDCRQLRSLAVRTVMKMKTPATVEDIFSVLCACLMVGIEAGIVLERSRGADEYGK